MKAESEWETVNRSESDLIERMLPGGWLYHRLVAADESDSAPFAAAIIFVPEAEQS
jgi:hypothetical protein